MADGNRAYKPCNDAYKTWFDISILVLAHLLLMPLWILLWTGIPLLIWLCDRGPVFYRQLRAGKEGKPISVLKFCTMVLDADRQGPIWTTQGDPRVTPVGKLLRRTALDELPELINILKREMSFVGSRALGLEEQRSLEQRIPGFEKRLQAAPGLTGLAQVYNRCDDAYNKFSYDLSYLDRMGPWLDVRLLVLSVRNTLCARWDQRRGKPPQPDGPVSGSRKAAV